MTPLNLLIYLCSALFSAYLIAAGWMMMTNRSDTLAHISIFLTPKWRGRIRRDFPRIQPARRRATGFAWFFIGSMVACALAGTFLFSRH